MTTRPVGVLTAVLSIVVGATLLVASGGGAASKPPSIGDGSVSTLVRPSGPGDGLPTAVSALPALDWLSSASSARRVITDQDYRAWVALGKDGFICLVLQDFIDGTNGLTCAPRQTLESGAIYISSLDAGGKVDLVGIVDDAVRSVEAGNHSVVAKSNAFIMKGVRGQTVTLITAVGSRTTDLGALQPVEGRPVVVQP